MIARFSRLLLLNSYHYGRGRADVVYLDQLESFGAMGWDTAVISMQHPDNLPSPWSEYFAEALEFSNITGLLNVAVRTSKVVWLLEAQRKVRRLLDAFPADVAHLHNINCHLSPSVLPVLHRAGVPVMLTAHGLKLAFPAYRMCTQGAICEQCRDGSVLNVVCRLCVRDSLAASAVVDVESALQRSMGTYRRFVGRVMDPWRFHWDKLIGWGWPVAQLAHVHSYVDAVSSDTQFYESRFEPEYRPGDYLLCVDRLSTEKGVGTLVQADERAGVPLRVACTGPMEAELSALAGPATRIEWLGNRSGDALCREVRGARPVVVPSECYENASMAVLDAYASGKPVIGTRIGGTPEIVDDFTGWTFRSGEVADLADVIAAGVCNSSRARRRNGPRFTPAGGTRLQPRTARGRRATGVPRARGQAATTSAACRPPSTALGVRLIAGSGVRVRSRSRPDTACVPEGARPERESPRSDHGGRA